MKQILAATLAATLATMIATPSLAANNFIFNLVRSSTQATCAPNAAARVTIAPTPPKETMHVEVWGLPANTALDLFITQVPKPPFGMSWYQGDLQTDANGRAVGDFEGRFNIETFIVAPGAAPAPVVHAGDAATNPVMAPLHTFHVGIWFNSPTDAARAGCPTTVTPFNGTHNAGVQVLNSSNFPDLSGPLRRVQ
ncbi:hypothetical protein [Methylocystis sp. ATCC 49242]|uniref:hypothetical protein n=1 Tax=Methylocystis sp. ATCC 49242 TaxID=622637 RepID=UPI0001F88647|nr:hypothetical protein [Methylocystis sp. ATCC 49242]